MKYAIKVEKIDRHCVLTIEVFQVRFYPRPSVPRDLYCTEGHLIFRGHDTRRRYSVNVPRFYEERSGAQEEFVRVARSDATVMKEFG